MYHKDIGSVVALTPDQRSAGAGPICRRWTIYPRRLTPEACWTIALSSVPAVAFLLCSPLPGDAMKQPVQRRLAAILAADVAGYSRLMGVD